MEKELPYYLKRAISNERKLCRIYEAWLKKTELAPMSADELRHELWFDEEDRKNKRVEIEWLGKFISLWEEYVDGAVYHYEK